VILIGEHLKEVRLLKNVESARRADDPGAKGLEVLAFNKIHVGKYGYVQLERE
jgi:hypothetical protein